MSDFSRRHFFLLAFLIGTICLLVLGAQATAGTLYANSEPALTTLDRTLYPSGPDAFAPANQELLTSNCRHGVAALGADQIAVVDDLGSGLYLDFGYQAGQATNGAQYVPIVRVKQLKDANGNYLPGYDVRPRIDITNPLDPNGLLYWLNVWPNSLWLIGNEVERGPNPGDIESPQGDTFPEIYAEAYHDIVAYIRQHAPSAKVAVSGLVQVTPGRLQYLDIVWEAHIEKFGYPMDVDVWNMHIYILPEVNPQGEPNGIASVALGTDPALGRKESGGNPALCPLQQVYCVAEHDDMSVFAQQVLDMRLWMYNKGQRNKPLLLSEFSLLYPYEIEPGGGCFQSDEYGNCFTPPRVEQFLTNSINYLRTATDPNLGYPLDGNRLVQQWIWFSISHLDGAGQVSNLYNNDGTVITTPRPLGTLFKDTVLAIPTHVNLIVERAGSPGGWTDETGTADVEIWATFRNNGNTHIEVPFDVTFYSDPGLTNAIGTATISADPRVAGCSQMSYHAQVTWHNLTPGVHKFWARLDNGDVVAELTNNDNVISGLTIVDPEQILLPATFRP